MPPDTRKTSSMTPDDGWSQWGWDPEGAQWYRTKLNQNGEYLYEYNKSSTNTSIPRGRSDPLAYSTNTNQYSDQTYYQNVGYEYQGTTQTSKVDSLSKELENTSINSRPAIAQSASYGVNEQKQTALPAPDGEYTASQQVPTRSLSLPINTYENTYSASAPTGSYMTPGTSRYMPYGNNTQPGFTGYHNSSSTGHQNIAWQPSYQTPSYQTGSSFGAIKPYPQTSATENPTGAYASSSSATSGPLNALNPGEANSSSGAFTPNAGPFIRGTPGQIEKLDSRFRVHQSRYFKKFHVFKVLWSEPTGVNHSNASDVTIEEHKFGEKGFCKIRRFVIVRCFDGHSQCLPILTYQHQGTTKLGSKANDHAIIYTGDRPPKLLKGEYTLGHDPIRVDPRTPRDKLEVDSRINFAKIYTVEHNVKVFFIGKIAEGSRRKFVTAFDNVNTRGGTELDDLPE